MQAVSDEAQFLSTFLGQEDKETCNTCLAMIATALGIDCRVCRFFFTRTDAQMVLSGSTEWPIPYLSGSLP